MKRYSITKFSKDGASYGMGRTKVEYLWADTYQDLGGRYVHPDIFMQHAAATEYGSCAMIYDWEKRETFYLTDCDF